MNKLKSLDIEGLKCCCLNLESYLKHDLQSDIDGKELASDPRILKILLTKETTKAIEMLNYIKRTGDCFPNAWNAYRVLLTIPVTVASTERRFSKLKLIKNYLRSTMSQERLNGLAILSIEKEMIDKHENESIINNFAAKKARRMF